MAVAFPGSNVEDIEDGRDDDDDDTAGQAMAAPGTRGSAPSKNGSVGQASYECVKCGQVLLPSAKFCTECGTRTGGAAAAAPAAVIVSVAEVESIAEVKEEKLKEEAAPKKQQRVAPEDVVDIVSKVREAAVQMRKFYFRNNAFSRMIMVAGGTPTAVTMPARADPVVSCLLRSLQTIRHFFCSSVFFFLFSFLLLVRSYAGCA